MLFDAFTNYYCIIVYERAYILNIKKLDYLYVADSQLFRHLSSYMYMVSKQYVKAVMWAK